MTSTPPKSDELLGGLGESWIELGSNGFYQRSPDRITPLPFSSGEEYLRLLREAQRESKESSRVVSLASSRRDTPRDSPKSPPNSPNTELCTEDDLKGVYINYWNKDGDCANKKETDWIWEWSSRPDQQPPKGWNFEHPKRKALGYSMRLARVGKNSLFSKEVLYSLLLTNVLSLLLGAGFGWGRPYTIYKGLFLLWFYVIYAKQNVAIAQSIRDIFLQIVIPLNLKRVVAIVFGDGDDGHEVEIPYTSRGITYDLMMKQQKIF